MELEEGAKIIINRWLKLKPWDRLMIVAGEKNMAEAGVLKRQAEKRTHAVSILLVERQGQHVGVFFDQHPDDEGGQECDKAPGKVSLSASFHQ